MNKAFTEWINNITGFNAALRIYTLNYDRLFKSLLAKEGMNLFEGFVNEDDLVRSGQRRGPDIRRILSDSSCNVHYNLHGSASWSVENQNDNGLPGYTYLLQTLGMVYRNYATIEIERGKKLLLTPLITGFQKVQRTAISPFRQMFSAFDSDCLGTDVLYIIGYSFGDEHINDIIRNAKKYNLKMKVVIVDPNFDEQYFFLNFLSSWIDIGKAVFGPNRSHKDPYEPYNVYPIRKTFKDYLTDSTSSSLLA